MDSLTIFRKIILENELDGDAALTYRFSDPDGVRTGKSGYSFGLSQFDIANNPSATLCLREAGFTAADLAGLKAQNVAIGPLEDELAGSAKVVDRWDDKQLFECLTHPQELCRSTGIRFAENQVLYHLADYHNQFYMSRGGKMHRYLLGLGRPVQPHDVLDLKLETVWGRRRPDDVHRRYDNIVTICQGATP